MKTFEIILPKWPIPKVGPKKSSRPLCLSVCLSALQQQVNNFGEAWRPSKFQNCNVVPDLTSIVITLRNYCVL